MFDNLDKRTFKKLADNLHEGLYIVDRNRVITYWNKAAEKITGFTAEEVVGKSCADDVLTHVDDTGTNLCVGMCPLAKTVNNGISSNIEVCVHHKKGHRIPLSVRTTPLTDNSGNIIGAVELFTDLSSRQANEQRIRELERLALLDSLTQLANRRYAEIELQNRIEEKKRFNIPFGILFMDIDHFRNFNENYGHNIGDKVLEFVAETFISNCRPFDIFGRWGGEEFIGIIRNVGFEKLGNIGNRMRLLVEKSYLIHKNKKLSVTISVGATVAKDDDTIESIVNRADMLLYKSKHSGRNQLIAG